MKSPTNVTGPDGTICKRGDAVPAAWFKELPDLRGHLDAVATASGPVADEPPTETSRVDATMTTGRRRTAR